MLNRLTLAVLSLNVRFMEKFSTSKRIKSFAYAFKGLVLMFREEHNSRIHLAAGVLAVLTGFLLNISMIEWVAIVLCIGWVLGMEAINSALERICDLISKEKSASIEKIKDLAAAGVLISALTALGVGMLIFLPKILCQFFNY